MNKLERAAMQQALEALEESVALNKNWASDSEPEILSYFSEHKAVIEQGEQAIATLREALAEQAEQEPVGYVYERMIEPFGICKDVHLTKYIPIGTNLYAAPVRTKDLTDDEIHKLVKQVRFDGMTDRTFQFARAAIAADRSKNRV